MALAVLRRCFTTSMAAQSFTAAVTNSRVRFSAFCPEKVATILRKAQARDVAVMDMRQECSYTHYFILATGESDRHVERLARAVLFKLKEEMRHSGTVDLAQDLPPEIQGEGSSGWVVVDAGDIIVHLMTETKREFLNLSSLWGTDERYGTYGDDTAAVLTKDTITTDPQNTEVPSVQ